MDGSNVSEKGWEVFVYRLIKFRALACLHSRRFFFSFWSLSVPKYHEHDNWVTIIALYYHACIDTINPLSNSQTDFVYIPLNRIIYYMYI